MFRRSARLTFALAACVVATSVPAVVHALPPTALKGQFGPAIPLKNAAMIDKNEYGWIYKAGQQDSRLTVTYRDGRVHFADTGTRELRDIPSACRAESRPPKTSSIVGTLPLAGRSAGATGGG